MMQRSVTVSGQYKLLHKAERIGMGRNGLGKDERVQFYASLSAATPLPEGLEKGFVPFVMQSITLLLFAMPG